MNVKNSIVSIPLAEKSEVLTQAQKVTVIDPGTRWQVTPVLNSKYTEKYIMHKKTQKRLTFLRDDTNARF